ncbi:MAG TPA: MFS transporter [Thermomicrobiales bacterium]|nr:MFS transporter [Thermomicrobiales bacterium]HRA47038.1 MFS transporter [Thermomicrobiales bacterium]
MATIWARRLGRWRTLPVADDSVDARATSTFHALKTYQSFRRLWIASVLFTASNWMQNITLGWLGFMLTDSERYVGLLAFAGGIPFVVVSIPGGALLDRYDRRKVLMTGQFLAAVVAAGLAFFVLSGRAQPWHLLIAAFLNGCLQAIISPSQQSLVPRLVDTQDLQNALGLMSAGGNMTRVVGPALSGVLIAALGTGYPFVVQAIAVLAAFIIIYGTVFPTIAPSTGRLSVGVVMEGARIVARRDDLREIFLLTALPSLLIFPYLSFLNVYAEDVMKIGSQGLGLLLACSGVGAVIGGLMIASRRSLAGIGSGLYLWTGVYCLCLMGFSLFPHVISGITLLAAAGLIGSFVFSANNALMQARITDDVRGRVMGTYILTWGLMPIGALWMGEVAQVWGVQAATFSGAFLCLLLVIGLRWKSRALHAI